LAGVATPIFVFVAPYVLRPETLPELWFNLFEASSAYVGEAKNGVAAKYVALLALVPTVAYQVLLLASVLALMLRHASPRTRAGGTGRHQLLFLASAGALFAGYGAGQAKEHYLVPVLLLLLLPCSYWIVLAMRTVSAPRVRLVAVFLSASGIAYAGDSYLSYYTHLFVDGGRDYGSQMASVDVEKLVDYVQTHSADSDSIWVYYNAPEVYWLSNRKPATNEPIGSWLVHYYGPRWFDRTYMELMRDRPTVIIGLSEPRYSHSTVDKVTEIPKVMDLISNDYRCDDAAMENATVCTLNRVPST
jgi:hypothetical protein